MNKEYNVFIAHASEDKESFVRPLALALRSYGLKVWYDEFSLDIGSSLSESIDRGLADSRFGIVVLSHNFINKRWPKRELRGLTARDVNEGNIILPIWNNITKDDVIAFSPPLADVLALNTSSNTLQEIVEKIVIKTHSEDIVDLKQYIPTGISILDTILHGGLPRPSSTSLIGVKGIGKSTLATQIQISALFRGEPCIYITYREPPFDIIERFLRLNAPIEDFINRRIFRILDNFSEINGLSKKDVEQSISNKNISNAIVRIKNPSDSENYYKKQLAIMDEMGTGGINIIDSVNERYELIDTDDKSNILNSFEHAQNYYSTLQFTL